METEIMMKYCELEKLNTPCYIIDEAKFRKNVEQILISFRSYWKGTLLLGYSVKTNHNKELMKMALEMGMLAETVSDDEYFWAEKIGFSKNNIIYNGIQKTEDVLLSALQNGGFINIDNINEIEIIEKHKQILDNKKVHIGIRVNFDLERECPNETTAGKEVSRFGFCMENGELEYAISSLRRMQIEPEGLHLHYSSKTRSLNIYSALAKKACDIIEKFNLQENLHFIDIGGGFFGGQNIAGKPTMDEYAKTICGILQSSLCVDKLQLILEPGSSIIATAVDYVSKVIQRKKIRETCVVTLDGSNLHINPFLANREPKYQLITDSKMILPVQIICGSTCMENDRFLHLQGEPQLEKGDYVYFTCVGAYTIAFNNCFINLPPCIYVRQKDKYVLCRNRDSEWLEQNL